MRALATGALLLALAAPAAADRLVTADGRVIELPKARPLESGDYRLVFESGEIVCPGRFVASVEMEGDMSDYVPANADEEQKLAQGYVRWRGRWMSKSAYLAEQKKLSEAAKAAEIAEDPPPPTGVSPGAAAAPRGGPSQPSLTGGSG